MRLVIEASDFRRLSTATQKELIKQFAGRQFVEATDTRRTEAKDKRGGRSWEYREPIDLDPELTVQLLHGLAENHRKRLLLFARNNGRVSMKELLKVTGDKDPRVLSYFNSVVTRKLRRILGDTEKKAYLIGWDYDSTRWNKEHTVITDGTYYVTGKSADALENYFNTK
ncbi:MAG: hypothetical protein R3286_03225 [Gammaproteobacteria bacterium]|nr:hypothetical protein [Gammaproteobacteria bacterium]